MKLTILEATEIMHARPRIWKRALTSFFWARHLSSRAGPLSILDFARAAAAAGIKAKIVLK